MRDPEIIQYPGFRNIYDDAGNAYDASLVLALDGNSAGANTIQEAKNGRKKAAIFVCRRSRLLAAKAATLEGYVTLFDGPEALEKILEAVEQ